MSTTLPLGRSFVCVVERGRIEPFGIGQAEVVFDVRVMGEVGVEATKVPSMAEKASFPGRLTADQYHAEVVGSLREVRYRTNSTAFARRMRNVALACDVTFEPGPSGGPEAEEHDRKQVEKTRDKVVVILAEGRSITVDEAYGERSVNYAEVTWRKVEPLDRIGEVSPQVALALIRRIWSVATGHKRPHEKVDEIIETISMLEVI